MDRLSSFLQAFRAYDDFAWTKINHGFWEALADVGVALGWPPPVERHAEADEIARRPFFFVGGFVDELLRLLATERDERIVVAMELSAWPGDDVIIGTPFRPEVSQPMMERFWSAATPGADGLLLKRAVGDGSISLLFEELAHHRLVVVGPEYISDLGEFIGADESVHIAIHPQRAREERDATEAEIAAAISGFDDQAVVLLQAGTLAPYWILRLRARFPNVRWIDGGLAFSICAPSDILKRPWGKAHREGIVRTYNSLTNSALLPERPRQLAVQRALDVQIKEEPVTAKVRFVHDGLPDSDRVGEMLEISAAHRQWANRGPLVRALEAGYQDFLKVPSTGSVAAVANGGLALETLARVCELRRRAPIRWGVSAFTFKNQARGHFASATPIDCDTAGMLDIEATERAIDGGSIDGFVVTNIFGLWRRFDPYIELARRRGAPMLIDNAAGIGPAIPDWDHQAFSLHHTKPFGFGEGGLAIVPTSDRRLFDQLLSYDDLDAPAEAWVNNGKMSEVAAAHLLDRLERSPQWAPFFEMQGIRILHLAIRSGLRPLFEWPEYSIAMSMPFISERPVPIDNLSNEHLTLGKYYQPIATLPTADWIHRHIVNIPSHPDVSRVSTSDLLTVLGRLTP